jgi:hypothetical protein
MAKPDFKSIDLVNGPLEQAMELSGEQVDQIVEQMQRKPRTRPLVDWLHQQGLTLKEVMEAVDRNA